MLRSDVTERRCLGRTRSLRRCGRYGTWRFFCADHRLQPILWLAAIVSFIAAVVTLWTFVVPETSRLPQGSISVIGAMPLHLMEELPEPDGLVFRRHRLGLIVKLTNDSDLVARVDAALLSGCVPLEPWIARDMLLPGETMPEPFRFDDTYAELRKTTIQGIRATGGIRNDSKDLPAASAGYVGILFDIPPGGTGAQMVVPRSATTRGDCAAIENPTSQPTVQQLFVIGAVHTSWPHDLAPEFRNGWLNVSLNVAGTSVLINPDKLGALRYLRWRTWKSLDLARMYEVPDTSYPPTLE